MPSRLWPSRFVLLAARLLRLPSQRLNLLGRIALPIFSEARAGDHIRSTVAYLAVCIDHFEIEFLCISPNTPSFDIRASGGGIGR